MSVSGGVSRPIASSDAKRVTVPNFDGSGGGGPPTPPGGQELLVDNLANYLVDDLGNYLTGNTP